MYLELAKIMLIIMLEKWKIQKWCQKWDSNPRPFRESHLCGILTVLELTSNLSEILPVNLSVTLSQLYLTKRKLELLRSDFECKK